MKPSHSKARRGRLAAALAAAFALGAASAGCAEGGAGAVADEGKVISKIEIEAGVSVAAGEEHRLVARAIYEDGSTKELTGGARWASSNDSVATITEDGMLRAVGEGMVGISVNYLGVSETATLVVLP
ncbi:MAG TPA: Ig-like domain-containing protein [Polyangiaceae bacterium]|nr:Ig-like domain-containing protein [Polyangiaceae bacterium]